MYDFNGVYDVIKLLFFIALVSVPLALWKIVDIILWIVG
jgi:hypothetical protein